jgi:hypothetical protein
MVCYGAIHGAIPLSKFNRCGRYITALFNFVSPLGDWARASRQASVWAIDGRTKGKKGGETHYTGTGTAESNGPAEPYSGTCT